MGHDVNRLTERAAQQARIRAARSAPRSDACPVAISLADLEAALEGFTPFSLQGLTLQPSSVSW